MYKLLDYAYTLYKLLESQNRIRIYYKYIYFTINTSIYVNTGFVKNNMLLYLHIKHILSRL